MYLNRHLFLWFYMIFIKFSILKAEFKVTILHTNDMHSRIEETSRTTSKCIKNESCYGGFARLAYQVQEIKSKMLNALFLNAGDTYQGTPMYSFFKWEILVPLMNKLGIDVMSLGNHEFDDGIAGLVPFLQKIRIPVVTCNLDTSAEPLLTNHTALKPWHMLSVENVKIGVIGYITPDTKFLSSTGNVTFLDEVKMIKKYAKEAKSGGANLIFAVGHSGFLVDQEIARNVPDVDVVVGGHTDTFLYTGTPPDIEKPVAEYPLMIKQESGKTVPVVQAYGYTKYLGKLDLVWDKHFKLISATGNPILLNSSVLKDENVENEILGWSSKLKGVLDKTKGATKVFLDGSCRAKECNFGNFITDAILNYVSLQSKGILWTDAPIIVMNSGAIRTSIKVTEDITWGDLLTVLPFGNQLVRLSMKGSTLLKALERSIERYDVKKTVAFGEFLQVSGLKVEYMQNEQGRLVLKNAMSRCANCSIPTYSRIEPNKKYSVVTTFFVSDGGDGYTMFKKEATKEHIYDEVVINIVAKYLERMSPIYPEIEGRIIIPDNLKLPRSSATFVQYNFYLLVNMLTFLFIKSYVS